MAQLFVSYSRQDAAKVDRLIAALEQANHNVWVDREDIRGGDQWRRQIVAAIKSADLFLIVLSPNSVKSDNVRKELDLAEGVRKRVLPLVLERTTIPDEMHYQLVGLQQIDLSGDFQAGLNQLLAAIAGTELAPLAPSIPRRGLGAPARFGLGAAGVAVAALVLAAVFGWLPWPGPGATPTPIKAVANVTTPTVTPTLVDTTATLQTALETAIAATRQAEAEATASATPPTQTPTSPPPPPSDTPLPPPTPVPPSPTSPPPLEPTPTADQSLLIDDFEGSSSQLEGSFQLNRNAGNEGQLSLVGIPHVSQGRQALAFAFDIRHEPPDHYIGFDRTLPPQDWSGYAALCVWIESDGSNRTLVLQFGEGKNKFWKQVYSLAQGSGDTCLALAGPHQLNLRNIGYYGLYVEGPPTGQGVIYIDNVRLATELP
jgi:hypothetical protein